MPHAASRRLARHRYHAKLMEEGFDDMYALVCITDGDLKELGVSAGHRYKLLGP